MRGIVLSVLFVLMPAMSAQAQQERVYSITVAGQAAVMAVPDIAVITLSIENGRIQPRRSDVRRDLNVRANILMLYLREAGVNERKIKMLHRRTRKVYDPSSKRRELLGYEGTQQFRVIVPHEQADDILDDLPDFVNEDSTVFVVSNEREFRESIVDDAIADAKARAARRAEKLSIQLGPVIGFNESFLGQAQARPMGRMAGTADESRPQLPPGENELRVNVSITYRINVPE